MRGACPLSIGLLFVCLAPCACQNPLSKGRTSVAQELATRRANREKSMRLYRQALKAYKADELDEAHEYLDQAVTADDRNSYAWMALGVVEFKRDRLLEAARAFHRAGRLEPTRYEPHFNIGTILESVGRYERAIEAYEAALKLAPNQLEVMENLARCYIRTRSKLERARELVNKALQTEDRPEWRQWLQEQAILLGAEKGQGP